MDIETINVLWFIFGLLVGYIAAFTNELRKSARDK